MSADAIGTLLSQVSDAPSFSEAAQRLVGWAKDLTGCQAAMLRFRQDDPQGDSWIPALCQSGFGCRFLRDEILIGAHECLCGRICRGALDDRFPFFTPGGSFSWGSVQSIAKDYPVASLGDIRGRCITEGYESIGIYPIAGSDSPIGCLHLADASPGRLDSQLDTLEQACRLCGPLLLQFSQDDRRGLFIKAVEDALLPSDPPRAAGLDIAVSFTSATEAAHLGGDFYDVIQLAGGDVLLIVGDYSGKGIGAAGMAARARYALACAAESSPDIPGLLKEAESSLLEAFPQGRFVTAVICRYSPDGRLRTSVAGHLAPVVMEPDGRVREMALPHSPPLAAFTDTLYRETEGRLEGDQTLLLYTDGISESRCSGQFFGLQGIARVWQAARHCSLEELTSGLCTLSTRFHQHDLPTDDRLALAVRPMHDCG
jgi:serine phosphatase RsbU (regulator of sigma subunit)